MQPIRSEKQRQFAYDPWTFQETNLGENANAHAVSDMGEVASGSTVRHFASWCGCLAPPKGFCAVCSKTACAQCFGFCDSCHMPLCPRHSIFQQRQRDGVLRLCRPCHDGSLRKRIVRGVSRTLFSLFIRFEDEHGQK